MSEINFILGKKVVDSSLIYNYIDKNYEKPLKITSLTSVQSFYVFIEKFFLWGQIKSLVVEVNNLIKKNLLDVIYKLVLNLRDPDMLQFLFDYINYNTILSHVTLNGLPYYERTNMWDNITIEKRPEHDPDVECNRYQNYCDAKPTIKVKENDDLQYIVEYIIDCDDMLEKYEENIKCDNFPRLYHEISDNYSASNILLIGYNEITITNECGINEDHRGSTHCAVDLKYECNVEFKDLITLHDLVTTFYRIKSHKFNKGYEMYCAVKSGFFNIHSKNKKTSSTEKYRLVCNVDFDHGS